MDTVTSPLAARLVDLHGAAWSLHEDAQQALTPGMALEAGAVLATGPGSELRLLLASGRELTLGPDQCLCLDEDVLAPADADSSEWRVASHADPAVLAGWLEPALPALTLEGVLTPDPVLDLLLGPATDSPHPGAGGLPPSDDPGLTALLRSLYGPDAG